MYKIYNSPWKFAVWFLCFVFTIMSIKVYINNFLGIQNSIHGVDVEINSIKTKISYYNTYKIPYLESDVAFKFLKHQNALPDDDTELIIKLNKEDKTFEWSNTVNTNIENENKKINEINISNWNDFLIYKLHKAFNI